MEETIVGGLLGLLGVLLTIHYAKRSAVARPEPSASHESVGPDQVAAVCFRRAAEGIEFLLVRTDGGRWVFPKGHVKRGENPWMAAEREALEEAGVVGKVDRHPLARFVHHKRGLKRSGVELVVDAFLLELSMETVPAGYETGRDPTWCRPEVAERLLSQDREPQYQQAYRRVVEAAVSKLQASASLDPRGDHTGAIDD